MKLKIVLFLFTVIIFSGCAHIEPIQECLSDNTYGFWSGLWHGIIAPITFICKLFDKDIAVYATNNNGTWYDFGFLLGIGAFTVSSSKSYR